MGNRPATRITGSKRRKALLHSLYPRGLSGNPMKQSPPQPMIMRAPKLTISGNPMKQSPSQPMIMRAVNSVPLYLSTIAKQSPPQPMIMRVPKLTISGNPVKQSPPQQFTGFEKPDSAGGGLSCFNSGRNNSLTGFTREHKRKFPVMPQKQPKSMAENPKGLKNKKGILQPGLQKHFPVKKRCTEIPFRSIR